MKENEELRHKLSSGSMPNESDLEAEKIELQRQLESAKCAHSQEISSEDHMLEQLTKENEEIRYFLGFVFGVTVLKLGTKSRLAKKFSDEL